MKKKGFTLIEIIIVIVILGIMASLALPKLINAIDKGQVPAALGQMGKMVRDIDSCCQVNQDATKCADFGSIGVTTSTATTYDPGSTSPWTYYLSGTTLAAECAKATGKCLNAGTITFTLVEGTSGASVSAKSGSGAFNGFSFR